MKKIFALVLAMVMVLTAVSALAAGSKDGGNIAGGTVGGGDGETTLSLTKVSPTDKLQAIIDAIKEAGADGASATLATLAGSAIPEGFTKISEAQDCYQLSGDTANAKEQEFIFKFATPFADGEEVLLLIGISPADGDVEWLQLTGKGNADGDVVVKVTAEQIKKISNNPFIVIPVTKEAE